MKKLILLIAAVAISHIIVFSQGCLPEGITFNTQEEIDNFQTNYPGCTEILGGVYICDSWLNHTITNLNGLNVLTSIDEGLRIGGGGCWSGNPLLTSLTGLENLTSIGEHLEIYHSDSLASLTGLEGLTSIGGMLVIESNNALTSLTGLDNLTSIGGELSIDHINALASLTGLDNLTSIGGRLHIDGNDALTSLTGLDNVTSIGGHLGIYQNHVLTSLAGLDDIDAGSVTNLSIVNNISLSTCDVQSICDYLASPNGTIYIAGNAPGCNSQLEVEEACAQCLPEGIYFSTQEQIDNFQTNYPGCTEILGGVGICDSWLNPTITNLNGLNVLTSIDESLWVGVNSMDPCVNPLLTSLTGLENLASIGIALEIHYGSFASLTGLEGLTSIGGELDIESSNALVSLTGLDNLTSIGGSLHIDSNDALTSLTGLDNVTSIGGDLGIYQNHVLTSLAGLDNIDAGTVTYLGIANNISLSTCDVQSICDYLASPNGSITIYGNAPGCNSPAQVQAHCLTTVEEIKTDNGITVIPNPSKDKITISSPAITGITSLSIFNVNGEKVMERQSTDNETQIDISALRRGVYFVRLQNEKTVEVGKIIKQ